MKEIQDIAKKLRKFYLSLAQVINNGTIAIVLLPSVKTAQTLMQQLQNKVQPYSKYCAMLLEDIQTYLFVPNINGSFNVNPYRFGKFDAVLTYLESLDFVCDFAKYIKTPWEDINKAIRKLLEDSAIATERLSYNQVGVLGREIYILLATKIYKPKMNNRKDGKKIGPTDTKGMIGSYIDFCIKGASNDELRDYAHAAIKLAEHVTHSKTENKIEMDILVTAIIALVSVIDGIYKTAQYD